MKKLLITFLILAVGTSIPASANPKTARKELEKQKPRIENAITRKAKEFKIFKSAERAIHKEMQKVAPRKLKKTERIDIFDAFKKESKAQKRLLIARVETRDLNRIRRITHKYCEPRTRVPDGGMTLALLGVGLLGLLGAQRLFRRA